MGCCMLKDIRGAVVLFDSERVLIVKYRHSCRLSSMVDGRRGRICGSRCVLGSLQNCTFCGQFDYGVTTSSSLGSQEQQ